MKTAIYTVIFNDYDSIKPIKKEQGFDYIIFTDDLNKDFKGWRPILIDNPSVKKQREIKICPHKYLKGYDLTIYIDGSRQIRRPIKPILAGFNSDLAMVKHHKRRCVYEEAKAVKEMDKADPQEVDAQVIKYRKEGMPNDFGMYETSIIFRRNTEQITSFCEDWYAELEKHTHRDQLSVTYALWKTNIEPQKLSPHYIKQYIKLHPHKQHEAFSVYYSSPYRADKNIGGANNEFIARLPDNAWICITDADAMFLNPDYGSRIERIIKDFGNDYQLIGCLTNRIGSSHQCYNGQFSNDWDVRHHHEIAQKELPHEVKSGGVAGFFMLFSKRTWKAVGGFRENTIAADTSFNKDIKRMGGKCGVYQGLYMLHIYRIAENDQRKAQHSVGHLMG